jgi:hypothetical protein
MATKADSFGRNLAMIVGFGIGGLWILLALLALWSGFQGFANDRSDWGVGWVLVGSLLLLAGLAAAGGTWWHLNRVLRRH